MLNLYNFLLNISSKIILGSLIKFGMILSVWIIALHKKKLTYRTSYIVMALSLLLTFEDILQSMNSTTLKNPYSKAKLLRENFKHYDILLVQHFSS